MSLCERLKEQACHCSDMASPGSSCHPITIDDDSSSYVAPKVLSPTLRPIKPPTGGPKRVIAEDVPLSAIGTRTPLSCQIGMIDELCLESPACDRAESTGVVSSVRGQQAIRMMGRPKGVFLPAECQGHRMQTGISLKAVARSSTIRAKTHKAAPVKGREICLVEELDKRR